MQSRTDQHNFNIADLVDHPAKTDTWYEERRQKAVDEDMLHIFAQEVDRNYSALYISRIRAVVKILD